MFVFQFLQEMQLSLSSSLKRVFKQFDHQRIRLAFKPLFRFLRQEVRPQFVIFPNRPSLLGIDYRHNLKFFLNFWLQELLNHQRFIILFLLENWLFAKVGAFFTFDWEVQAFKVQFFNLTTSFEGCFKELEVESIFPFKEEERLVVKDWMLQVLKLMVHLDLLKTVSLLLLDEAEVHTDHDEMQDYLLFLTIDQFPFWWSLQLQNLLCQ